MPQTEEDRAAQEEMLKNPYEGMGGRRGGKPREVTDASKEE